MSMIPGGDEMIEIGRCMECYKIKELKKENADLKKKLEYYTDKAINNDLKNYYGN